MKYTLNLGGICILKKPLLSSYDSKDIRWSMGLLAIILPLLTAYIIYTLVYLSFDYWLKILMILAIPEGVYLMMHFIIYLKCP